MADPTATVDELDSDPAADAAGEEDATAAAAAGDASGDEAAAGDGEAGEQTAADDGEITVSLGDEPANAEDEEKRAPEWVRDLRKANREKDRRIRELEAQVATGKPAAAVVVGERPTLAACDYDEEKFAAELESWQGRKFAAEQQQRERAQAEQQQQQHWATRLDAVTTAAKSLKVADLDEAQAAFEDTFSIVQQGIIIGAPDDAKTSALLRYALGKNPKKAKELAAISDPVKFTFAIAKLEGQLKVAPRKSAPPPDTAVRSPGAGAQIVSQGRLKQLHEQAQKTGNYTEYFAAKRQATAPRKAA